MSVKYRNQNGDETIIAGLTPGGDIEAGASAIRSGIINIGVGAVINGSYDQVVTFTDPMPDNDYIINFRVDNISPPDGGVTLASTAHKANSFRLWIIADSATYTNTSAIRIQYTAIKVYSVQHDKQNTEAIATIQQAIPAGAGAGNKLTTKSYVDSEDNAIKDRLDALEDLVPNGASISDQLAKQSSVDALDTGKQDKLTFDNVPTSESDNPVKSGGVYNALATKAPIASPAFTGIPTAPTPSNGSSATKIATTEFISKQLHTKYYPNSLGGIDKNGWYRIAIPYPNDGSGTIAITNTYGTGGPTSLYMYFNLSTYAPVLKLLGKAFISGSPITNARMVNVGDGMAAIDIYYNRNVEYKNSLSVQIMWHSQTSYVPVSTLLPTSIEFIGNSDTLPTGNTLLTMLDQGANVSFNRLTISYPAKPSVTFKVPMFSNTTATNTDWNTYTAWQISRSSYGTRVHQIANGQTSLRLTVTNQSTGECTFTSTFSSSFGTDLLLTTISNIDYTWMDANKS